MFLLSPKNSEQLRLTISKVLLVLNYYHKYFKPNFSKNINKLKSRIRLTPNCMKDYIEFALHSNGIHCILKKVTYSNDTFVQST